jgi:hypothetical protein
VVLHHHDDDGVERHQRLRRADRLLRERHAPGDATGRTCRTPPASPDRAASARVRPRPPVGDEVGWSASWRITCVQPGVDDGQLAGWSQGNALMCAAQGACVTQGVDFRLVDSGA